MTVFVAINVTQPAQFDLAVKTNFAEDHLQISPQEWLIAASGSTAKDISDKLGITDGSNGSAIIFVTAGYYGRAPNNIWEWISVKLQRP